MSSSSSSTSDPSASFDGWALHEHSHPPTLKPFSYHPRPLGADDVEISITHCGVCATDCHFVYNEYASAGVITPTPLIVGHEIVGIVRRIGNDVSNVKVGDRVGVGPQRGSCNNKVTCERCKEDRDNLCPKVQQTYGFPYPDGQMSHGGYCNGIRIQSHWAIPIPSSLLSAHAAPLLCAGPTMWTPMKRWGIGKGKSVGVVGLGGLGHIGVLISSRLGADTWTISTSSSKKEDAERFGSNHFVNMKDEKSVADAMGKMDLIVVTSDSSNQPWDTYISMLKFGGKLHLISVPKEFKVNATMLLFMNDITISATISGSPKDQLEVLEFFSKHQISPEIEEIPMDRCNDGIQKIMNNSAKYRTVLHN